MDARAASDNLQVIRTLMERASLYRRALAPIMLSAGMLGTLAAVAGLAGQLVTVRAFGVLWFSTASVAVIVAFLLARRQALKDHEPFWSSPTRRVTHALLPALTAGLCVGVGLMFSLGETAEKVNVLIALLWMLSYGCALHAAGFFMVRGIRWLGWIFIAGGCAVFLLLAVAQPELRAVHAHFLMGAFFGLLQVMYGGYLYATEKRKNAA